MRILLTGKGGQVGHALQRRLATNADLFAVGSADCDLANPDAIRALVKRVKPNVIINPAAYTAVDRAESEPEAAHAVNAVAPGILAEQAEACGATLIHFSTDYVFDGLLTRPYTELDPPCPTSVYGASKLAGEQAIQSACSRYLILRTSWVYGLHGNNFAKTMLRLATERDSLNVVADQFGTPTSAERLAEVTEELLTHAHLSDASGVYHITPTGQTNWHAYASHVIQKAHDLGWPLRTPVGAINAIPTSAYPTPARRPTNSVLSTAKFQDTFDLPLPAWQTDVDLFVSQLDKERATRR